jgi:hypothetical protein
VRFTAVQQENVAAELEQLERGDKAGYSGADNDYVCALHGAL